MGEHEIGIAVLLFAFLGSPVAWSVHFLVIYFLVTLFCTAGWSGVAAAVWIATALLLAVSAASGVVAFRTWRERSGGQAWDTATAAPGGWATLLLVMGMLGAVLFTALIAAEALPVLFVAPCPEGSQ